MSTRADIEVFPAGWLWLFPPAYLLHLIDERFWGPGTAAWATANTGVYFTNSAWLAVNVPSLALLTVAAAFTASRRWPAWVAVALGAHLTLHALVRIVGTVVSGSVSPGVVTGVAVCLPLATLTFWRGFRALSGPQLRAGLITGVLSFQPLWHFLLLPFLPGRPPAA